MVGDVNIYINDPDNPTIAEIEIMIAESSRYYCRIGGKQRIGFLFLFLLDSKHGYRSESKYLRFN